MQTVTAAFLAGAVGSGELIFLFVLILVLFGPRRLPSLARDIGRFLSRLQRIAQDFRDQIMNIDAPHTSASADMTPYQKTSESPPPPQKKKNNEEQSRAG